MKLEITFREATDTQWEQLHFQQEGLPGMKLPGCWLLEFVSALETNINLGKMYIYQDYHIINTHAQTRIYKGADDLLLLQLDAKQRAKLIAHLKSTYAALL